MKISRNKKRTIIVFLLLFAMYVALLLLTDRVDKQTDDTTSYFTATVIRTEISGEDEKSHAFIYTEEYYVPLVVQSGTLKNLNSEKISSLQSGQKIGFHVENTWVKEMETEEAVLLFIPIVSLKTEEQDIFSLQDYNAFTHVDARNARIHVGIFCLICLGLVVFSCFRKEKCVDKKMPEFRKEFNPKESDALIALAARQEGKKMIEYEKEFGQKETDALIALAMQSAAYKESLKKGRIFYLALCMCFVVYGIDIKNPATIIFAIALAIFFWFRLPTMYRNRYRKTYEKMDPRITNGFRQYRIDESGIDTISYAGNSHRVWDAIACCGEQGDFIWMKEIGNTVFLLDKTILSEDDIAELHRLFSAHNIPY